MVESVTIMYRVINKTSKKIFFEENEVAPDEEVIVCPTLFDEKRFKDEEVVICEIGTKFGEHSCSCYGNITCTPQKGTDGTVFEISEK